MSLTDMVLFNSQVQKVATETVDQNVQKFNEASNGGLILGNSLAIGDYLEEASYKIIANLINRRDASGTGGVSDSAIQQMKDVSVKVDGRIGPIKWTMEQFNRLGKNEKEAGLIIGEQAAEALIQDYLNVGAGSLKAAINNQGSSVVHDATAGKIGLSALNKGAAKFGDRSASIVAWLMHSTIWHDLVDEAIQNSNTLFTIGDINVMEDGLGRRYVVSDIPDLITSGAPDTYDTLGLTVGAVQIETGPVHSLTTPISGEENLGNRWQGEYSFMTGLKGYKWETGSGGSSPSNVALKTGTNWTKLSTSIKDTAGVSVRSQ